VLQELAVSGPRARTGWTGAAAGTTTAPTARRRTATGTRRRTGTTTSASDLPELRAVRGGATGRNRPLSRSARTLVRLDKRMVGHPALVAGENARWWVRKA